MLVQAEISLYPLGETDVGRTIYEFIHVLERPGLTLEPGPMSTLIAGESELVFTALREAYEHSVATGRKILVLKVMNG